MAEIKISRLEPFPAENPNGWVVGFTVLIEEKKNFYEVTTVSYDETDNEKEAVDLAYEKLNHIDSFIYTPGDLNQDNIIDILDLVTVVNFVLGNTEFTNLQIYAGDINEDSIINIQDIIMIINIILSG